MIVTAIYLSVAAALAAGAVAGFAGGCAWTRCRPAPRHAKNTGAAVDLTQLQPSGLDGDQLTTLQREVET